MLKEDYYIERIDYDMAMAIVRKYHYLHRVAPCKGFRCAEYMNQFSKRTSKTEIQAHETINPST